MTAGVRRSLGVATAAVSILLAAGCAGGGATPPVPAKRWNVVWIVADDMSPDIGAYGDPYATTPNLDRLAAEGVRFTHAFANAPVCAPARSTLHTGMYATTLGSHHMRSWAVPPAFVHPVSELVRRAGYYTTNNAKVDWNMNPHLESNVMRAVREPPVGAWDESSRTAHWRNRPPGQPFFAVFDLFATHESRIRLPDGEFAELTAGLAPEQRHDPRRATLPPYYPDHPAVRRDWARYHDLVTVADSHVGRILRELAEDGLEDETVVLFFSDHGRGLPRAKRWLYDSGVRVPLLVRWPGRSEPGSVNEELVSFVDFAPTLLAIAGVAVPEWMQGRVFLGAGAEPEPRAVPLYRDRMDETYDNMRGMRDRRFKYIRNFEPEKPYSQPIAYMDEMPTMALWRTWAREGTLEGAQRHFFAERKPQEELYDTVADPHEVHDLASVPTHAQDLGRLRTSLAAWQAESGDLGMQPEAELIEHMRPTGGDYRTAAVVADPPPGRFSRAVTVELSCPTAGAAVVFTEADESEPRWRLHTAPLPLERTTTLRVKAGRLGFFASEESVLRYEIASSP